MMQADDAIHPALAACASLDSVELFDVDLGGGSGRVSVANASSPLSTDTSSAAHRSTSSSPPVPAMTCDSAPHSSEKALIAQQDEEKTRNKHVHTRKLSAYNLISPVPALEKVPSSDSATVTTTSSGSMSMSSSSSMLSAMDNDHDEDAICIDEKAKESESNDRGVYHFKVSKVTSQMERRQSGSATTRSPVNRQSGETKSNGKEIIPTEATSTKSVQTTRLESINEASQITTVSTMPGPDDNKERAGSDQRGVYRFKVHVDEAQLRRAEWWKLW